MRNTTMMTSRPRRNFLSITSVVGVSNDAPGVSRKRPRCIAAGLGARHKDHPAHAETVSDHSELRRKEGFGQRHLDLAALGKGVEIAVGFRLGGYRDRKSEAAELGALATAVGGHDRGVSDPERRVHHFVFKVRLHPGWVAGL